ncbi:hypothetical protein VTK26DRAFT_6561 [Humicola hyalothermophila]
MSLAQAIIAQQDPRADWLLFSDLYAGQAARQGGVARDFPIACHKPVANKALPPARPPFLTLWPPPALVHHRSTTLSATKPSLAVRLINTCCPCQSEGSINPLERQRHRKLTIAHTKRTIDRVFTMAFTSLA